MIQDVAMAFRYLHSFNPPILHRNLKSTNIMVNSGLQVKVRTIRSSRTGPLAPPGTLCPCPHAPCPLVLVRMVHPVLLSLLSCAHTHALFYAHELTTGVPACLARVWGLHT